MIQKLESLATEKAYGIVIEKLYNLCLNSQTNEAYALAGKAIKACAQTGNMRIKAWYERYLCVVHFYSGRMKDSVLMYEKSLELSDPDREYLGMHSIDIYAAKSYQMLGYPDKAVEMITGELQRLRNIGRYEELTMAYLFAAEISYQNTFIDRMNGGSKTYESTMKYFALAEEYAPLYRKTEYQVQVSKLLHLVYSLITTSGPHDGLIGEIQAAIHEVNDYYKTIALARLFGYYRAQSDYPNAIACAKRCIEIGEPATLMLLPTLAYGVLCGAAIAQNHFDQAVFLTRRFLRLSHENGIYEYFRLRQAYDPILEFAWAQEIELDITQELANFSGFVRKSIYVETFGSFSIYPYQDRQRSLKLRSRKERELLAYLLEAGAAGVTKEQIRQAIWSDSKSDDVPKLIGVHLAQLKKDLAGFGIDNVIVVENKRYRLNQDAISADWILYESAPQEFQLQNSRNAAQKLATLYKGEYLAEFEALWAVHNRIRYENAYEAALQLLKQA